MKAPELIGILAQSGGALRLEEGQLVFDGSAELLQRHREEIAALRPQLVEMLSSPCSCETADGWLYRCELHQDTPAGKVLVEPAPDARHAGLVDKATALFGGRALEARR